MKTVGFVGLVVMLSLIAPALAAQSASWRVVARANGASEYYASATMVKGIKGALAARLAVSASGPAKIDGNVSCTNSAFDFESRSFAFTTKLGTRALPLPLRRADCNYFLTATLSKGGAVRITLSILK